MNIDGYRKSVQEGLHRLQQVIANANDILENRIVKNLKDISRAVLVDMPTVRVLPLSFINAGGIMSTLLAAVPFQWQESAHNLLSLEMKRAPDNYRQYTAHIAQVIGDLHTPSMTDNACFFQREFSSLFVQSLRCVLQDRTVNLDDFVSMQEHNVRAITDQLMEKNKEVRNMTRHQAS